MKNLGCGCLIVIFILVSIVFEFCPGLERALEDNFGSLVLIGFLLVLIGIPVGILLLIIKLFFHK